MVAEIRGVSSLPQQGRLSRIRGLTPSSARLPGVFLFFLVLAVIETWPLILHINTRLADSPHAPLADVYNHIWHLRWIKQSLIDLQTYPLETKYLFFPDGDHLYLGPVMLINGLMSLPVQLTTDNLILSWNIVAFASFALSGLCTYALAYRVTNNHLGSILAGFIFAFAPFVMAQFNGRLSISTVWPMPLIALFFLMYLDTGRILYAVFVGILWAALVYNFGEFAMDTALFLGVVVLYWSIVFLRQRDKQRLLSLWRGSVAMGVVWLVLGAPMLIGAFLDVRSGDYEIPQQDELFSADLRAFITPSPLWGPGEHPNSGPVPPHVVVGDIENTLYFGGVPLLLATIALFSIRRSPHRVLLWLVVFLVFTILAIGPYAYWDGKKLIDIPMPYQIYEQVPMFSARRVPPRMIPYAILGLSLLAAIGFDLLTSWLRRHYRLLAPVVGIVVIGLVVLEYWNPPVHLSEYPRPAALERIKAEPGDFAVLDAPLGRRTGHLFNGSFEGANTADYYAALHGKRAFGGFFARTTEHNLAWLRKEPGLRYLAFPFEQPQPDDLDPSAVKAAFSKYRIKYVILHRVGPHGELIETTERLDQMDRYIREVGGLTPMESDSSMTVYRNQAVD